MKIENFSDSSSFRNREDSSSSTKRNINLTSVEVLRPQAGSYDKRYWTRVFQPAGRFKTSQGEVCRGHGTSNYSAIPLTDVLLEAVYF